MPIILNAINLVAWAIFIATLAATALFVLRVIVTWAGSNPFGWVAYNLRRVTEPVVRPMRQPFYGYHMRFDLLPLVAAAMILFSGLFLSDILWRLRGLGDSLDRAVQMGFVTLGVLLTVIILLVGLLYEVAIFGRVVLPWFGVGYGSSFLRFLFRITEPLLRPLRRALSRVLSTSIFDFTPIIALLLVRVVTLFVAQLVSDI